MSYQIKNVALTALNQAKLGEFQLRTLNYGSWSCSFSRHAKTHASMVLVIWLNENVHG